MTTIATKLPPTSPDLPLVGRAQELAFCQQRIEEACAGRAAALVIQGEAGLGKSRLAAAIRDIATAAGMTCLEGRCADHVPVPYMPIADIIEQVASSFSRRDLESATKGAVLPLIRIAPGLRRFLPDPPTEGVPPQPEQERHASFAAVRDLLDSLSRVTPLLLIIDDIHWADEPSLLLLRYLLRLPASRRVLIVLTARTERPVRAVSSGASALVAEIERRDANAVLHLDELTTDEVTSLIAAVCRREPPSYISAALYKRTGGNPLFVEQVLFELLRDGLLFDHRDRWIELTSLDSMPIPAGVHGIIDARLHQASAEAQHLLTVAAVAGLRSDYAVISAVSRLDGDSALSAIEWAERANLITIDQEERGFVVSFRHDLIRQDILGRVSLPRLQATHLALAQTIESLFDATTGEYDSDLALHYLQSGSADHRDSALRYLQSAARRASRATAFEDAARLYAEALALVDPAQQRERCLLLLQLGEARKRVSDSDLARDAFAEAATLAESMGDARAFAAAALGYSRSWPSVGSVDDHAVELLNLALQRITEDDLELKARLLAKYGLQMLYSGAPGDVLRRAREAVECSRLAGDKVTLARALQVLHAAMWQPSHLHERLKVADEIIEIAAEVGDESISLWGIRPKIADLMELGDVLAAEANIQAYDEGATLARVPIYLWQAAVRRAMVAIFRGNLDGGESLAQKALELGRQAEGQNLIAAFGGQLLVVRWQQGRLPELRPLIEASLRNEPNVPLWAAVLAFIEVESGNRSAAAPLLDRLAQDRFAALGREDSGLVVLILASLVCHRLGDGIRAEQLFELLEPYEGRNIVVSEGVASVGAASGYLGMLAATARRFDEAERLLRDAIDMNSRMGGRPWLARAQFELARVLLTRRKSGDRRDASELIRTALGIARDGGYRSLQDEIEAFQRAHKRLTPDRLDGLTPRETEVLALIASGKSTREISDALVLSARTTARHVTNIYAKIGVRNRVEATAYALRHGLAG